MQKQPGLSDSSVSAAYATTIAYPLRRPVQPPFHPSLMPHRTDPAPLTVLHADQHLIVVDKPAELLSVPGRGAHLQDCVASRAQAIYPDALIVHRLDMSTSGLLVLGRGAEAQRTLSMAFEQRRVHKRYEAVVVGRPAQQAGTIDLPLRCDWPNRPRQMVDHELGKPSVTHWRALGAWPGTTIEATRVELEPVTGRSHQLRVHLLALGHPILGDNLYASGAALTAAPRLLLHACALTLPHPLSGEPMQFDSAAPF
jgi:tRNA pseudouridine32 synthase/23S rRNA pseudouridine746 synthase